MWIKEAASGKYINLSVMSNLTTGLQGSTYSVFANGTDESSEPVLRGYATQADAQAALDELARELGVSSLGA